MADPLAVAALALWCFLVALIGGLLGLVLGNIRLPLVVALAAGPAAGAGANLGISGVAAATASISHIRAGRVDWRMFRWMAPPSVVGALVGSYFSGLLPDAALLAVIGAALLYFGIDLLRPGKAPQPRPDAGLDVRAAVWSGALIGLLGGTIGLILGTLRMPALIRSVGLTPERAIGTNLTVGICVGAAGLIGHTPEGIDWDIFAVGALASIPGALIGARLTGRLSKEQLLRAIGVVLVLSGGVMLGNAAVSA
ncbi:MAG: sulfite exporter TauE/SafE family protein [Thermoleophilaceae bacterium]|nr:sulfite exporter TauE/SafE family protein [Thermoleophilaceae bacterium]